jgi:hypothetical protein
MSFHWQTGGHRQERRVRCSPQHQLRGLGGGLLEGSHKKRAGDPVAGVDSCPVAPSDAIGEADRPQTAGVYTGEERLPTFAKFLTLSDIDAERKRESRQTRDFRETCGF